MKKILILLLILCSINSFASGTVAKVKSIQQEQIKKQYDTYKKIIEREKQLKEMCEKKVQKILNFFNEKYNKKVTLDDIKNYYEMKNSKISTKTELDTKRKGK